MSLDSLVSGLSPECLGLNLLKILYVQTQIYFQFHQKLSLSASSRTMKSLLTAVLEII